MSGTTFCPYCSTRFKVTETQLESHSGMVRCGYCQQTFDARPGFVPDQPSPQLEFAILELPILDVPVEPLAPSLPVLQPMTLAEQISVIEDEADGENQSQKSAWPWILAVLISLLLLLAQAAYFFRIDIAARLPALKPVLVYSCALIKCDVPLPQQADLISIESSELDADPDHAGWINLNALLRNRAAYAQAFPNLELTLTDSQDSPLARRTFHPADYLPPLENRAAGFQPNRELAIKLPLDTADLQPMGYRLVLFYAGD